MKEGTLINKYYRSEQQRYDIMFPNVHFINGYEMDICAIRKSGYLEEIEVKTSKADFKADFSKSVSVGKYPEHQRMRKHEALVQGKAVANYFSFLVPLWMYESMEFPGYAGVYVIREIKPPHGEPRLSIRHPKKPRILHKDKVKPEIILRLAKRMTYRYWDERLRK